MKNLLTGNPLSLKLSLALVLTPPLAITHTAYAEYVGEGATTKVTTVKKAVELKDDSRVIVEGYIVKQLHDEIYLFKDNSGEVEMEIDDEDFRNIKISASDKVRITAEVDRDWTTTSLEAEYVELVK